MDDFRTIYAILRTLQKAMDCAEFDATQIGPEALGISQTKWVRLLEMLADVGYIKGVQMQETLSGATNVNMERIRITLKGLEYLEENKTMRKIYNAAKGIRDLLPM